jgi:hypothetical protein
VVVLHLARSAGNNNNCDTKKKWATQNYQAFRLGGTATLYRLAVKKKPFVIRQCIYIFHVSQNKIH